MGNLNPRNRIPEFEVPLCNDSMLGETKESGGSFPFSLFPPKWPRSGGATSFRPEHRAEVLGGEALGEVADRSLRAWGLKQPSLAPADLWGLRGQGVLH